MKSKPSFWQRIGMHDWFLKNPDTDDLEATGITPEDVYKYIVQKFQDSIGQLSFAGRVVFYHEYIIAFNSEDYKDFMDGKKGIFGLIVQESVRQFYEVLKLHRLDGKNVQPSSSKWVFRFVSNPEYAPGDMGFIGKLLPGASQKEENLRVTYIPRQTGIAQTADISGEILKDFTFYSEGYYEIPYQSDLAYNDRSMPQSAGSGLARLEAILPDKAYVGKKVEYLMKDPEIIVSGSEDTRDASNIFRVPSEWVNTPHLRIRYDRSSDKFYLASFGEKTLLNEKAVALSDTQNPNWIEVPVNSKLLLNGIVGINLFKS
ncbi:MAG: hypothetical protein JWP88_1406 [Flaviaesturariibacter sp.]|nr:hypothetical protein [Flaviaesturariibacter sp.]